MAVCVCVCFSFFHSDMGFAIYFKFVLGAASNAFIHCTLNEARSITPHFFHRQYYFFSSTKWISYYYWNRYVINALLGLLDHIREIRICDMCSALLHRVFVLTERCPCCWPAGYHKWFDNLLTFRLCVACKLGIIFIRNWTMPESRNGCISTGFIFFFFQRIRIQNGNSMGLRERAIALTT